MSGICASEAFPSRPCVPSTSRPGTGFNGTTFSAFPLGTPGVPIATEGNTLQTDFHWVNDIQAFTEILPNTEPLYGISIVLTVSPTVVPEPASLVLLAYVWGGRDLRAVAPRSDSGNFPGFFSILCSVFRDSVVTILQVIS